MINSLREERLAPPPTHLESGYIVWEDFICIIGETQVDTERQMNSLLGPISMRRVWIALQMSQHVTLPSPDPHPNEMLEETQKTTNHNVHMVIMLLQLSSTPNCLLFFLS